MGVPLVDCHVGLHSFCFPSKRVSFNMVSDSFTVEDGHRVSILSPSDNEVSYPIQILEVPWWVVVWDCFNKFLVAVDSCILPVDFVPKVRDGGTINEHVSSPVFFTGFFSVGDCCLSCHISKSCDCSRSFDGSGAFDIVSVHYC